MVDEKLPKEVYRLSREIASLFPKPKPRWCACLGEGCTTYGCHLRWVSVINNALLKAGVFDLDLPSKERVAELWSGDRRGKMRKEAFE